MNDNLKTHLCIQCVHYLSSDTPSGNCDILSKPVWSRRPQCAAPPPLDLFEPLSTIGNRLRTAREKSGKARDEVCIDLSIPMRSLQNWETDSRKPPGHTIQMLLNYYKT